MEEQWKDVVDYEEVFMVSNLGNLYSKRSKREVKQTILKSGYASCATRIGGRKGIAKCFRVHMLVANAFLDSPSQEQLAWAKDSHYGVVYVNHIDGDKTNNKVNNLEWVTAKENSMHYCNSEAALNRDRTKPSTARLSDEQVREVRLLAEKGTSERKLAKIFKVGRTSINNAKNGYRWVK